MKLFVPILDNGGGMAVCASFLSIWNALTVLTAHKSETEPDFELKVTRASASHANRGMNTVTSDFLASDCDEMLIVDIDVVLNPDHLVMLFEHDQDLVYGCYFKKQPRIEIVAARLANESYRVGKGPAPANLTEVRRSGRGLMRVKRAMFERLAAMESFFNDRELLIKPDALFPEFDNFGRKEKDFWQSGVVRPFDNWRLAQDGGAELCDATCEGKAEWITEDWMFCEFCRQAGQPIYIDDRIQARHADANSIYPLEYDEASIRSLMAAWPEEWVRLAAQAATTRLSPK